MTKQVKRTKKGRFAKGTGGGPGRKKRKEGEVPTSQAIRDAFYKTFIQIFVKSGDPKELVAFCKKNQMNMRLLIQEVRKILPEMASRVEGEQLTYELSDKLLPKLTIERIFTDKRPEEMNMPRPGDEQPETELKEDKVIDIESLSTKQIEAEIKILEARKKEIEATNKVPTVKVN